MIENIDFCVSFIGENSGVLGRMFFGLLTRFCNLDGIKFHLVNKQVSNRVWSEVVSVASQTGSPVVTYEFDSGWNPYRGGVDSFSFVGSITAVYFNDAARTAEWVVNNCGSSEWCILSHFDLIIRADIVDWLKRRQESTGRPMVGSHCPIMLLNRPAYYQCGANFHSSVGDVSVELANEIGASSFEGVDTESLFHHMGGAGCYHTMQEFKSMRERAIEVITREGL